MLKIKIVILTEITPKIADEIHTIIRRMVIGLNPPTLQRSGGILTDADKAVKNHQFVKKAITLEIRDLIFALFRGSQAFVEVDNKNRSLVGL